MEHAKLLSKFKGSVYAALVGDCIGAHYETGWSPVALNDLKDFDNKLKQMETDVKPNFLNYTDDSEMAFVLANSLTMDKGFNATNVSKRFAHTFFASPPVRWYGASVGAVFDKICKPEYAADPYKAASEQFDGEGSFGNGSGMRVFPVALYYHGNPEEIKRVAALSAKITHAHRDAVNGAILQAMAVEYALSSNSNVSWKEIWKLLMELAEEIEFDKHKVEKPYKERLHHILKFLEAKTLPSIFEIESKIGNGIKATEAVSCAIYSFLCCLADKQPAELEGYNKVQQTILYSISISCDTDTVATMAGAIAGAFYGHQQVPDYWLAPCEGSTIVEDLAVSLFEKGVKSKTT